MLRIPVAIIAAVITLLVVVPSRAQPLFTIIRDWTLESPIGDFGYQQIRQDPGGFHTHYLILGVLGRVPIDVRLVMMLGVVVTTLLLVLLVPRIRRRRSA